MTAMGNFYFALLNEALVLNSYLEVAVELLHPPVDPGMSPNKHRK